MRTLSAELLSLIVVFQPLFTKPTWEHAKLLLLGALLQRGKRTVTACLRVVGLSQEERFQSYHRVLNRASWSATLAARILLGLIILIFPPDGTIVFAADDTIERRRGKKISKLGCHRDPVRSTRKQIIKCFGLKWLSMAILVKLPWSSQVYALPFLTALCAPQLEGQPLKVFRHHIRRKARSSKKKFVATGKTPRQYKTAVDILMTLTKLLDRWLPDRAKVLVVDGSYAAIKLALVCASLKNTALVMRFYWNAALYHPPGKMDPTYRGPAPRKGQRQRTPKAWATRRDTIWEESEIDWYGGRKKKMLIFTRTALWHRLGHAPLWIRYVITRDPEWKLRDEVFACTDINARAEEIIRWFVMRWSLEVTFEEAREHLGMETQRQWSDLAIARTTPVILGLFSLVMMLAHRLQPDGKVPILTTAWYQKTEATFSDCLALVRKHLWNSNVHKMSAQKADVFSLSAKDWEHLLSCLSAAA
jgi:hypothetical protein